MNVVHVVPSYFPAHIYGGPIVSTHQMNLALAAQGVNVRVITTDANGQERLKESETTVTFSENYSVKYCPRTFRPDISIDMLRRLPSQIRWADVVHVTAVYSFPTLPALLFARLQGKPVVWSPRGAFQTWAGSPKPFAKKAWVGICRLFAPRNTTIMAASAREQEASQARMPGIAAVVIANGVNMPADIKRTPKGPALRLLFLGRLHEIKGLENLLQACARLDKKMELILRICGSGEESYVSSLKERAKSLGLDGKVEFTGQVDDVGKEIIFADSDLLLLPSFSENFGLVVAEALAHGVPVIASKSTPWDKLDEKACGMWVDNDVESLAAAIEIMSTQDLGVMGSRGREWMISDFAWPNRANEIRSLYKSRAGAGSSA